MKEAAELETRKQIFNLISENPGLNISKIAEILNIETSLTIYHLRYLLKNDLINIVKERGYTRCYIKGEVGVEDKKILSILRQELPLKIVLFLLKNPFSKHKDILGFLDVAPSTLSYHLKKLMDKGIVDVHFVENGVGYVVISEKRIISFLIKYKPSRVAMGMKDTWADFTIRKPGKKNKR